MNDTIPLKVSDVHKLGSLLVRLRGHIAMNGRLGGVDRSELLPLITSAQKLVQNWLQLPLFSDEQMEKRR